MKNSLQKRMLLYATDSITAQEVEIINPEEPELVSLPKKRDNTERSSAVGKIITIDTK